MTKDLLQNLGIEMMEYSRRLFPICRSLTGNGVRETLKILDELCGGMQVSEIPTGTQVFDWQIPDEWNIRDAYILDPAGRKIVDFHANNLHVLGYSEPVDATMSLDELMPHLYSLPEMPDAVPYVTSYYKRRWGFCMTETLRQSLVDGNYRVYIDSDLGPGSLTYAELFLPGETDAEVLISSYVCHPSMANNEVSGPVLAAFLSRHLRERGRRRLSYRFVFVPETIGSIAYLSQNYQGMRAKTIAGFVLSCVGDDRSYSYVQTPDGNSLTDRVLSNVLGFAAPEHKVYSFLERGSDERQYNAPGIDLPVCCFCRSKFAEYPEYHTSLDNLSLISAQGYAGSLDIMLQCIDALEHNQHFKAVHLCEPQLGKRGLYPTLSRKDSANQVRNMMNLLAYCNGQRDLIEISQKIHSPLKTLIPLTQTLLKNGLIKSKVF